MHQTALRKPAVVRRPVVKSLVQRSAAAIATPTPARALQNRVGNRAVQAVVAPSIQTAAIAARVSKPTDAAEKEAEETARKVMRMREPPATPLVAQQKAGANGTAQFAAASPLPASAPTVHRVCAGCEEEISTREHANRPVVARDATQAHRSASADGASQVSEPVAANIRDMQGGGAPLPAATRALFEPRFGADFSQVRVHTGARADSTAKAISAKAFTVGSDIVFAAGQYAPESNEGQHLLAHELTHVVQQDLGRGASASPAFSSQSAASPTRVQAAPLVTNVVTSAAELGVGGNDITPTATGAPAIAAELKLTPTSTNVLPFPSSTPFRQPEPRPQLVQPAVPTGNAFVGEGHGLSSEAIFPATHAKAARSGDAVFSQGQTAESPERQTAPGSTKSIGGKQAQVVQADTVRSEAMIVSIAMAMHQRVSGLFGGLRARISSFFAQSSAQLQQFIANQQAQISAAVAQTAISIQALVARALGAAEQAANNVRHTIESLVQRVIASLQAQVQAIANQIIGVMSRFPGADLPGISQLRTAAASVVRRAAGAVTGGLTLVNRLITAALAAGLTVIQTIIGVARSVADAVISHAARVIQSVLQTAFQMLGRIAAFIASALQTACNSTILPILNRLEAMIHQAISTAQQHAISALRSVRDEYVASLGEGGDSDDEGSDELTEEALDVNRQIVQTFRERSSTIIGTIVQRVASAASQIMARVNQAIAMARQLIANVAHQAAQALRQIVQAVSSFIQTLIQGFMSAVTKVVEYVRALVQSPVDQLLLFSRDILSRMTDFIARIARNLVGAITGSTPTEGTGFFSPSPTFAPSPAFAPTPLPVLIAIFAFIIALLGGTVYLVGGTIIIIIGGSVYFISVTTAIIILVVVGLLLLLVVVYVTYRILRRRRRRKRPAKIIHLTKQAGPLSRTRTTIGVGEEVFLEYTQGPTTWTTTGGRLSVAPGVPAAKVTLDAPDTAGIIVVTAGTASVSFTVLAPSGVFMERRGGMKHTFKGIPDSGIRVRPSILPDTVNFYRITYHEMDIPFTPTVPGVYSCNPFKTGHCGAGGGGVPCPDLPVTNKVVSGKGTETVRDDCAYSGHCGSAHPHIPGSVSGNIPHEYKVLGPTGGAFHAFAPVLQHHSLAADRLTLTTTKASATGTIKVTDNPSSNGC
jgi:hypothetical protein